MSNFYKNKYFLLLSRIIIALVFIFAGIEKISNPESFAVSIENYRLFPIFSINIFALIVPWIEVFAGVLLLFNSYVKESSFLINSLLVFFIAIIIVAIIRGLDIECGCFGTMDAQKAGFSKIAENITLLILGINVYIQQKGEPVKIL